MYKRVVAKWLQLYFCETRLSESAIPGAVSERRLSENSEYVNPEMRQTLGFPFQNGRFVKPEKVSQAHS